MTDDLLDEPEPPPSEPQAWTDYDILSEFLEEVAENEENVADSCPDDKWRSDFHRHRAALLDALRESLPNPRLAAKADPQTADASPEPAP